jgi:hypothetical protein
MRSIERTGRFSTGQEVLPESAQHLRVGSFADGLADGRNLSTVVGRFSTGQELLPESAEHVRVGSFADGMRTVTPVSSSLEERKPPVAA